MNKYPLILMVYCLGALNAAIGGDFDGKRILAEWRVPTFSQVLFAQAVTVGPGTEMTRPLGDTYNVDIEGPFIQFDFVVAGGTTFSGGGNFNGWSFSDTNNSVLLIEGYEIDSASFGVEGLDQVETGFDADAVWADFEGVMVPSAGDFIRMKVLFAIFQDGFEAPD